MDDSRLLRVDVLVKTFLRDNHLKEVVSTVEEKLPEVRLVIVDDGEPSTSKNALYLRLNNAGHTAIYVPFDSGFGAKSNTAIEHYARPYVLISSDDFDFSTQSVREGILKLVDVLDDGYVDIASGRVANNPYEGWLSIDEQNNVVEKYIDFTQPPARTRGGVAFRYCDLTVNYSLIRAEVLGWQEGQIHWDSEVKIGGGEHGAFFYDAKKAGLRVAYVPGVNINEQFTKRTDPRYPDMRARARRRERECFANRGIPTYTCFGGSVEYADARRNK